VKKQTAPLIVTPISSRKTATNNRNLHDVDDRAQRVKQRKAQRTATTECAGATKAAGDAETAANDAVHRADSLDSVIKGLDNYNQVGDVT